MRSVFVLAITSLCFTGCAVPQPRGMGVEKLLSTGGYPYWLYLPLGRDTGEKLPTVVSLHGLKPFDSAHGQCREWQQEADMHGLAIVAPDLRSPGLLAPLPLRKVTNDLERDGRAVSSIVADLSRHDWFNPDAVLLTSWSYGGYVAHWVANRYPKLFTCLAVRQSNFNSGLLDPERLKEYLYRRVGIFSTTNDFETCREESAVAAAWYTQHGFDVVFSLMSGRGHERIPGPAAEFFLQSMNPQHVQPTGFKVGMAAAIESKEIMPLHARAEADRLVRSDPGAFLDFCLRQVESRVSDYRANFVKTERIGDQMRPAQRIAIRFMREPFSVHMTWLLNPGQVCRALYVAGDRVNDKGEEMAVMEPAGWIVRIFVSEVMRPIHGTAAASESRRSINQFGFANMLRLSLIYFREVKGATLEFVGDAEFDGRAVWMLRRTLPQGDGLGVTLDLLVDKVWLVPLSAVSKGEDGVLLGRYEFFDVELNTGYTKKDFEELGDAW